MPTFFCLFTVLCLFKSRVRFEILRIREAIRNAVESVWPVSYVVTCDCFFDSPVF